MEPDMKILAAASILLCALPAHAETLVVNDQVVLRDSSVERPTRGSSMKNVESHFGAPASKHATVGTPPITRWDYPTFSVFFEGSLVIHAVALTP
jgi:hypothetical protein